MFALVFSLLLRMISNCLTLRSTSSFNIFTGTELIFGTLKQRSAVYNISVTERNYVHIIHDQLIMNAPNVLA